MHCPKFKYDDLACLSEIFEQNFWFFTWDLKSGYHHVSIRYEHRCFLGFSWTISFASHYNNQLNRFNTRYASPGSEAVDALVQDWNDEVNWVCPPIYLIPKVIRHMKRCRAKGALIVPEWLSGLFWPVLCKNQYEFEHFVKDVFVLPKIHDLSLEGPGQTSVKKKKRPVFSGCPVFNMLALKIDFS